MKWSSLKHNGVCLPPSHEHRYLSLYIKGSKIQLTPEQEEMAYAWAKKIGTPYVRDPVFAENFLKDFTRLLPPEYNDARIGEIEFSEILRRLEVDKALSKEEKKRLSLERKARRAELKERYGYAEVDGRKTEIANWVVEPPGIFMGRGAHPLRGRWKPRVRTEDITLNLGEDAPIPDGSWGDIVHDHDSMWLARWIDELTGKQKYVWLSDGSLIRQQRDKEKYDRAAALEGKLDKVRRIIAEGMGSKDERERKIATVCFLIDRLAMRVGDEKDEDESDTVGALTLRVEHIRISGREIQFDFLGKDSVRWQKTITVGGPDDPVLKNFKSFIEGKKSGDLLFDGINSSAVNRFLSKGMKGLTAKVFRTFHATSIVRSFLIENGNLKGDASSHKKLYYAKLANLESAVTCNHKKTPPKNWEEILTKKEETLKRLQTTKAKTPKQAEHLKERIEKTKLAIDLAKKTRDYNLTTSLKNYVDPRVYKAWADHVGLDWNLIYTTSLQKKLAWVNRSKASWKR